MPYVTVEEDIDIDDILNDCSSRELVEAAKWLVRHAADDVKEALVEAMEADPESFDRSFVNSFRRGAGSTTAMEDEFTAKMDLLSTKFYAMSNEDIAALEAIYEKHK